jgi:hypothetical protein
LGGRKPFFKDHAAGNKSGGFLLTMFALTNRRSDKEFTIRRAACAVQDGNRPAIGEAHLKHPSFNRTRAVSVACASAHSGAVNPSSRIGAFLKSPSQ